jgi:hypothetical protein
LDVAAAGIVLGLLLIPRFRLRDADAFDLSPSRHYPEPVLVAEVPHERGPVLVTVEYEIDPADAEPFTAAMRALRLERRRNGAMIWGLFDDPAEPRRYVESFLVESWAEHLRQHERPTMSDRLVQERVSAFHRGAEPPRVTHLLAVPLPSD